MDNLKLTEIQRYFDVESGEPLQLWFGIHSLEIDEIQVELSGIPLLRKESSGEIYLPDKTKHLIAYFVEEAKKKGQKSIFLSPKNSGDIRYPFAEKFEFLYSHIDYEYIPGLVRPWDKGFLTPVFFHITVLNKYSQHPEYKLDLFSETYGSISRGDEWHIAFGINKNKKVIMWLGDIDELPDNEKYYLRSENIQSDHDIHSEFYDAQIEVQWSEPSPQNALFHIRKDLNNLVDRKYGFDLFVLDGEVSEVIQNLDRPVFWEDKHIGPVVESFNRIFVESINVKELKKDIAVVNAGTDVKSKGSLKIFQIWIDERLKAADSSSLMCPFFVLYDFRVMTCHLQPADKKEEKLRSINQRLGLPEGNQEYEQIYDALIDRMAGTISKIIELI
jgi:hypothetical protein